MDKGPKTGRFLPGNSAASTRPRNIELCREFVALFTPEDLVLAKDCLMNAIRTGLKLSRPTVYGILSEEEPN